MEKKNNRKILEYFTCENKEHWLREIQKSDWGAGQYLYSLLKENKLKALVGATTLVLMLADGDKLVSFCTLAPLDDVQPTSYTPWVGFVYTFPEYRGQHCAVAPGDLFFARPSQLIRYSADEQQPWEYSWVGFNGACAHKLAAQLPFTDDAPVHHTSDPDGMRAALNNIYSSRGLQPQDEAAMVGYLYLFIAALMRETSAGKPHTASSSSQYVLNAIKYIQFNYSHDISIDDVAKSVGVSRSHLYRVFMLNVGKSPIDYLTEYRINEACKLLRAGSLSIAEVAVSVGFFDQFYFSRVFKRAKGVPPSKYLASQTDAAETPDAE